MKRILIFILLLPVFAYSFFTTSWTGSYIMLEENWKEHVVFTPDSVQEAKQIYEIDKYLYALKYQPILTCVNILSFVILIALVMTWIKSKFQKVTKPL